MHFIYIIFKTIDEPSFQIKCSVRLKVVPEGLPGPFSEISKNFFAGIQVSKPFTTNKPLIFELEMNILGISINELLKAQNFFKRRSHPLGLTSKETNQKGILKSS